MTPDRKTIVDRIVRAADHDIPAFLGFFTEHTVFRMGSQDPVTGRDAIAGWIGGYLGSVAGTEHEVLTIWESDDALAVRMDVTYRMRNGKSFTLPAITEMRLEDGRLTHYLIYLDPSPVLAES